MTHTTRHRYRLTFAKKKAMRFTSHLDLHRTWERTLRRASAPLAYSQGYNPRARINIGNALPLGFTGERELMDVWLERECDPQKLQQAIQAAAPPGLQVKSVEKVQGRQPALQQRIVAAEYRVWLEPSPPRDALRKAVKELLDAEHLPRTRRGKDYDLRPLVEWLTLEEQQDPPSLHMRLSAREGATGRPDELLRALGLDPARALIQRTHLILSPPQPMTGPD